MVLSSFQIKWKQALIIPAVILMAFAAGCRVEQEQAGELPDVDVEVEPGQLPEYEVEGPDVEIGTEQKEITVPDVDVDLGTEQQEVTVPDIDVELPSDEEE